jgi:hypothetical protein
MVAPEVGRDAMKKSGKRIEGVGEDLSLSAKILGLFLVLSERSQS